MFAATVPGRWQMKLHTLQNKRLLYYFRNSQTVWDAISAVTTTVLLWTHCVNVQAAADVSQLTAPSSPGSGSPSRRQHCEPSQHQEPLGLRHSNAYHNTENFKHWDFKFAARQHSSISGVCTVLIICWYTIQFLCILCIMCMKTMHKEMVMPVHMLQCDSGGFWWNLT